MIIDVNFSLFAPTQDWLDEFKATDYDVEKTEANFGTPYVSNQIQDIKVKPGIYSTDLNPDSGFEEAGIEVYASYAGGYAKANKAWKEREESGKKFISLFEIANMYKLAMFGSTDHVSYGVCDNPAQILAKWPHLESGKQRHFITVTPIFKSEQSEWGGWRWHKWGEYIGDYEIQHEYLYDEDIELVYVFHIYTLTPESGVGKMLEKELQESTLK